MMECNKLLSGIVVVNAILIICFVHYFQHVLHRQITELRPPIEYPLEHYLSHIVAPENEQCTSSEPLHCESEDKFQQYEALGSLSSAIQMKLRGKIEKAYKLFRHALALAPKHPDVLTYYGEFLEERKNIIYADQLYFKALIAAPHHQQALQNRLRTASIVDNLDQKKLTEIDKKRDLLLSIPDSNSALRRAKKEAYFLHIYHTVALEGNTMSLQDARSVLETRMAIGGKSVEEHNEIIGLDLAMQFINSTLVNRVGAMTTIKDILEIHKRVMGPVDPVESGRFRRTRVFVGNHIPAPPEQVPTLMDEFVEWLNSERAIGLHPIWYAALAHYKMVYIHPFVDGNGRTSRLLMNMILMQVGYPPVIIPKHFRHKYYETLQIANDGDMRPFVRFIAECAEHTLDLYLWTSTSHDKNELPALDENIPAPKSSQVRHEYALDNFVKDEAFMRKKPVLLETSSDTIYLSPTEDTINYGDDLIDEGLQDTWEDEDDFNQVSGRRVH